MAIHDMVLDNAVGAAFRSDANAALAALVTNSSNATAPTTTYAYMWWADTTSGWLKLRNSGNSAWIDVFRLSDIAFTDSTFVVVDNADNTKKVVLQLSSLSTGQTRTITVPDSSLTLAGIDITQNWTKMQRAGVVSDNDGAFDLTSAAGNDFTWTPTGADVLDFTNEIVGARGCILLNNASGYAITLGGECDADANCASALSTAGKRWINYWCYDGTNVAISYSDLLV